MEKHPSFGWATKSEIEAIENAPSPMHRKLLFKQLEKKSKEREIKHGKSIRK